MTKPITITKTRVEALRPDEVLFDAEIKGFHARRRASGVISYGYRYRTPDGGRPMITLGQHGSITAEEARKLAKKAAGLVADGKDPAAERDQARAEAEQTAVQAEIDKTKLVNFVLDEFVARYVRMERPGKPDGLKSADQIVSAFDRFVRPAIGDKLIHEVKRSEIVDMLDEVEDEGGPPDHVLAYIRKAFNWQMARDDDFTSPIIKGMRRNDPSESRRNRILTEEEIRDVWMAAEATTRRNVQPMPPCFVGFVRLLLLTGQRRTMVARWHADQIDGDRWIVPGENYKNGETQLVPITEAMRALLVRDNGFMVSSDGGKTAFGGFSKAKDAIDDEIARFRSADGRKPMPHWVFHDLRRTARSIMSRLTTADIAERVLGHAIPGVRGVYDHYEYETEKRDALTKLAAFVADVVDPDQSRIVPLRHVASRTAV